MCNNNIPLNSCSLIFKQNTLIECSYEELNKWSEIHHDILNEIIALFQHNRLEDFSLFKDFDNSIYVKRTTIEKNTRIKRKCNDDIFKILKEIRDTSFTLKNFIDENGIKAKYRTIAFFNTVSLYEPVGKASYFKIEYTKEFSMLCSKGYSLMFGNYAKINLQHTTKMKSKYSKALLELLESNSFKKDFILNDIDIKSYLKFDKDAQFSILVRQINRVYNEVNLYCPFTYNPDKKSKTIEFKINQ